MRQWTLKTKLRLALALMWLGLVGAGIWGAMETRVTILDERKAGLQNLVDTAEGIAKLYHGRAQLGAMTGADVKKTALSTFASMRFGTTNYLSVVDSQFVLLMHPTLAGMVGKSITGFKDPTGGPVYPTVVNATKDKGSGFAEYQSRLPGSETALPKIDYVKHLVPWDQSLPSAVFLQEVNAAYRHLFITNPIVILLMGGTVSLTMSLIIRNMQRELGDEPDYAMEVARHVADGGLAVQVQTHSGGRDNMLVTMTQMQQQLTGTIGHIKTSAGSIAGAIEQIVVDNAGLLQRTEKQASSPEEAASSVGELTNTMRQNADNAHQASTLAVSTSDTAAKGGEMVGCMIDIMAGVNKSNKRVTDVIGAIKGVVFQTNILALNAAIEAVRTDEQGRSFAAVAGEMCNLTRRSAGAAKEVKEFIGDSVSRVENGITSVVKVGSMVDEVVVAIRRMMDIMSEIGSASEEQSTGIEQADQVVNQMDEVIQQNVILIGQTTAAALSLEEQTQVLRDAVASFHAV